jgi:4-aminobutyrate aminotransferase-like enzyme
MTSSDLLTARQRIMGHGPLFYDDPIHMVRGEGVWLYDEAGVRYMDCYNNVPCVGHCHPHVVGAMHKQAGLLNTHSRYLSKVVVDYSQRLMALHDDPLSTLQMVCSGTEAIELALRLARTFTKGVGIICSNATYHGNSSETFRMTVGPFEPEFRRVSFPDCYRPREEGLSDEALCNLYLQDIEQAIAGFAADNVPFAGMLFCSIFANEGLPKVPAGYLQKAAKLVRDAGGVVIFDEVQAGFCRTGNWWGYQVMGCTPDIAAMGKPMGAGYPTGGVAARADVLETFFRRSGYFNTMAATPLQAAVASAVLDVIEDENLQDQVTQVGLYLKNKLTTLVGQYEQIGDVRGHGLFLAVDWVTDKASREPDRDGAKAVVEHLKTAGYLISNAGAHRNVLKVRPPLVFNQAHAEEFLAAFETAVSISVG